MSFRSGVMPQDEKSLIRPLAASANWPINSADAVRTLSEASAMARPSARLMNTQGIACAVAILTSSPITLS